MDPGSSGSFFFGGSMKDVEIIKDKEVVCEVCSHLFNRTNGDACLEKIPLPMDSETTWEGVKAPLVKCGRLKGHDGPHVGCIMQPIGDQGAKWAGLWRRFHVRWED
jgi:hypothetical protein